MAQMRGVEQVIAALQKLARKHDNVNVVVGYTQDYGVYVHEDLEAYHNPPTKAKFLEDPARRMAGELGRFVAEMLKQGATLARALLLAGLKLQRASQEECPVLTGALRNSAFTRLEE